MGKLTLIRHGQASFHAADYDNLSDLGVKQATRLGETWADLNQTWGAVYVGPKRRHRQTMEAVAAVYKQRNLPWPEPIFLDELDEHRAASVVKAVLSREAAASGEVLERKPAIRLYFKRFQEITRVWAAGNLEEPEFEDFATFRKRVTRAIAVMIDCGHKNVLAFTSGGPVSVAAGNALNLTSEATMELSWLVRNIAAVELMFTVGRTSLSAFNQLPNITDPRYVTLI